jgi:hypothetical protein
MNIDKNILFEKLNLFIKDKYTENDLDILLYVIKEIIYNDCSKNCIVKSDKSNWV